MIRTLAALLLCATACNEYDIKAEPEPEEEPTTPPDPTDPLETGIDTEPPPPDVCPDQVFPAHPASTDVDCENEIETGTFNPVVEWTHETFAFQPTYNNVMMHPIVASFSDDDRDGDIDADDTPDIAMLRYPGSAWTGAGVLTVMQGDGSGIVWETDAHNLQGSGSLAAGDIDGDGIGEILAVTVSQELVALEHDGSLKWRSIPLGLSGCYATAPAIADMDGDGRPEIVVGWAILDADGNQLGRGNAGHGNCVSFPADLDGDGVQEVVAANAAYRIDGTALWTNGQADGYPAVADFDADGDPEIVVVDLYGAVRLQDHNGAVLWSVSGAGQGPPTIADFDGDGAPEIGVAGTSTYTVLDGDGSQLWQNATVDASSGRTGSSVFDFEGDGAAEVVYADETRTWVYSGVDGSVKLEDANHTSWTWIEYPTVADVDGDGEAEIIVPNGQIGSTTAGMRYGITVIGDADHSWMPGRKIWNQHAYHITNVEDDGTIPTVADDSWLGPNSFRSGDTSGKNGRSAPDLVVNLAELCEIECDRDRLVVWVHPGNEGAQDSAGARLRVSYDIGGDRTLVDVFDLDPLVTGEFAESLQIAIEGVDPATLDALVFEVESAEPECREDNNELVWSGPFCR